MQCSIMNALALLKCSIMDALALLKCSIMDALALLKGLFQEVTSQSSSVLIAFDVFV